MLKKKRQLLMLPITMFIGLEEAFLAVDFTKVSISVFLKYCNHFITFLQSFVACGWGISNIGFAMICFGVANALAAGLAGGVAEKLGRVKLVALCALLNLALFGYMFLYEAKQDDFIKYCAFAAIWGVCDGVWLVVINGKTYKSRSFKSSVVRKKLFVFNFRLAIPNEKLLWRRFLHYFEYIFILLYIFK